MIKTGFVSRTIVLAAIVLLAGCAANRKTVYFQDAYNASPPLDMSNYELRIAPGDNLDITVSSPNAEADKLFYPGQSGAATPGGSNGYLVDEEGYVNGFPVVGRIRLGGLTRKEACAAMQKAIGRHIESPVVDIRVTNFKITVLGEVRNPGGYTIESGKVTLPEAIGLAGDLTIFGKRDDIMLCRTTEKGKEFHKIDLSSADIFYSPYYYLQQGDLIYVSPNKSKAASGNINPAISASMSVASFVIGIITLIAL